ncbi:MAG TPA: hypothetical protein VFR00_13620 [Hyphomicrobiaceae bacterium]|jgi:hypothetical protein|nr:hypothetical protein [Hyphomicrobiaceae bacterium]
MLGHGLTPDTTKTGRGWATLAVARLWRRRQRYPRGEAARTDPAFAPEQVLPAIVMRARDDARSRRALAQLGYVKVRAHYTRCKREGETTFRALEHQRLAPSMDLVRDWLAEERKRIVLATRWPFLMTMLVTIVAGIVFAAVARVLE